MSSTNEIEHGSATMDPVPMEVNETPVPSLEESLNLGLDEDVKQQFWSETWPELTNEGWIKHTISASSGSPERIVLATTKTLDFESSKEGIDYFATVANVIDFLNKTEEEPEEKEPRSSRRRTVTKLFDPTYAPSFRRQKRKKISPVPKNSPVDLTWKREGRNHFPKKSSSIGEHYQATNIPDAGTYLENKPDGSPPELLWDPEIARAAGIQFDDESDPIAKMPHNLREAALFALAASGYDANALKMEANNKLTPTDGSDWTQEQRHTFHSLMFRLRRDLPAVARHMNVPITVCHTYYLNTYKQSCEYRLLKTVCVEERESKHSDQEVDACARCGDGGNLLICDNCEGEYHLTCTTPPLQSVPEGRWECDVCVDQRFLTARDQLLSHTKLFETIQKKKRDANGEMKITYEYKPVPQALEAARQFVDCFNEILSKK